MRTEGDLYDLSGRIAGGSTGTQEESVLGRREQSQELRANVARDRARLATVEGKLQAEESRQGFLWAPSRGARFGVGGCRRSPDSPNIVDITGGLFDQ